MKRFVFTLDSLRRHKTRRKQQVENQLAEVRQAIAAENQRIAGLESSLRQLNRATQSPANLACLAFRLAESDYAKRIKTEIDQAEHRRGELQRLRDRLRDAYLAIAKEVESLNTLRNQQQADHRFEHEKQRQQELNDHVTHSSRNANRGLEP